MRGDDRWTKHVNYFGRRWYNLKLIYLSVSLQRHPSEQRHRLHKAEGHACRASGGDSGRPGSEIGGGEGTAEESPPAGRVTDETDYFRLADDSPTEESYLSSEC